MGAKRTITILDVAKEADVAPSTVSNALAGRSCVTQATKERIMKIVKEMNYKPSMIASSMVTKRTGITGVFVYNFIKLNDSTYSDFLRGVFAAQKGLQRILFYSDVAEKELHENICNNREPIDGAIIFCPQSDEYRVKELLNAALPVVLIGKPGVDRLSYVDADNEGLTYRMTRHLLELGHERIVLVNCTAAWILYKERLDGYRRALQEFGVRYDELLVMSTDFDRDRDIALFKALPADYTAVLSESADIVEYIYFREKQRGCAVGETVSVALLGYEERLKFLAPAPTSALVDYGEIAKTACEMLEELKQDSRQCLTKIVQESMIFTNSCRAPLKTSR